MMIQRERFNIYLLLGLLLAMICGCRTVESKQQKALSTLRVHIQAGADLPNRSQPVPIYRDNPFQINIEKDPVLTEANVSEARVIEAVGGFAISIRFERRGMWLLEQYTAANQRKHLVIFSQFASPTTPGINVGRWLAAPLITGRISDGTLIFTPDASREEADQIVSGLNNAAKKNETTPADEAKRSQW
jgi:hypothetical protein